VSIDDVIAKPPKIVLVLDGAWPPPTATKDLKSYAETQSHKENGKIKQEDHKGHKDRLGTAAKRRKSRKKDGF
jgi:hypothetical protein